jgi:hypothetical protein
VECGGGDEDWKCVTFLDRNNPVETIWTLFLGLKNLDLMDLFGADILRESIEDKLVKMQNGDVLREFQRDNLARQELNGNVNSAHF